MCPQTVPRHPQLQSAVAALCVAWWQKGAPGREQLIAQLTVYLCAHALTYGAPRTLHEAARLRVSRAICVRQHIDCAALTAAGQGPRTAAEDQLGRQLLVSKTRPEGHDARNGCRCSPPHAAVTS